MSTKPLAEVAPNYYNRQLLDYEVRVGNITIVRTPLATTANDIAQSINAAVNGREWAWEKKLSELQAVLSDVLEESGKSKLFALGKDMFEYICDDRCWNEQGTDYDTIRKQERNALIRRGSDIFEAGK